MANKEKTTYRERLLEADPDKFRELDMIFFEMCPHPGESCIAEKVDTALDWLEDACKKALKGQE